MITSTKTRKKKKVKYHQITQECPLDVQKYRHDFSNENPVVSIPIALSASKVNQFTPRPDQVSLLNLLFDRHFKGFNECIQSPTGVGKGYMLALFVANLLLIGDKKKILIIVPSKELVDDLSEYFSPLLVSKIYTGSRKVNYDRPIMISTYQSVKKRIDRFNPDLIISDEAHRCAAKTWNDTILVAMDAGDDEQVRYLRTTHHGFTATPTRLDGKSLSPYFTDLLSSPPVAWYIENDILPDFNLEVIDCPEFSSNNDDLSKQSLIFGSAPEIKKTVDLYSEKCMGQASLFFVTSVTHGDKLLEAFAEKGIEARFIHSKTKKAKREEDFNAFRNGEYDILINITLFKEGVNIPRVINEFQCRFTYSLALYMQMAGRLFRGKQKKTLYDLVGNSLYHGSPKLDFWWSLDGDEAKEKKNNRILCPHCESPLFQRKFLPTEYDYQGCCNSCHNEVIIYAENLPFADDELDDSVDFDETDFNLFTGNSDLMSAHDMTRFTRIIYASKMSDIAKTTAICNITFEPGKYTEKFIAQAKYYALIKLGKDKSSAMFYSDLVEFEEI